MMWSNLIIFCALVSVCWYTLNLLQFFHLQFHCECYIRQHYLYQIVFNRCMLLWNKLTNIFCFLFFFLMTAVGISAVFQNAVGKCVRYSWSDWQKLIAALIWRFDVNRQRKFSVRTANTGILLNIFKAFCDECNALLLLFLILFLILLL